MNTMTHSSEVVCVLWVANWPKYWAMVDIWSTTWEPQWITRTTCDPRELHGACKETQCRLNHWKLHVSEFGGLNSIPHPTQPQNKNKNNANKNIKETTSP